MFCEVTEREGKEKKYFTFIFKFDAIELYLFRTKVGLLVFHLHLIESELKVQGDDCLSKIYNHSKNDQNLTVDDLIRLNYALYRQKNMQLKRVPLPFHPNQPESWKTAHKSLNFKDKLDIPTLNEDGTYNIFHSFDFQELVDYLLSPLCPLNLKIDKFFESTYDNRLMGYTFLLTDPGSEESLKTDLFYLRRFYKESYQPAEQYLRLLENPEIVQTFKNIYLGMTLEGGVVWGIRSGHPFMEQFQKHAETRYFFPFLLAFHQRIALLHLGEQAEVISYQAERTEISAKDLGRTEKLRLRILDFLLHCRFSQVSNVTMHNQVYERWCDVLRIHPLLDDLKVEVEELDDLLQRHSLREEEKARQEEEKVRKDRDRKLNLLTYILLPLTLVTGIFGMNIREFSDVSYKNWQSVVTVAIIVIPAIIVYLLARKKITSSGSKTKKGDV